MVATVEMREPGVVVLSASFDPGWKATVDGHRAPVLAVAPALLATRVPAGRHTVRFQYHGFSAYPELFVVSAISLLALAALELVRRRRGGGSRRHRVGSTIPA